MKQTFALVVMIVAPTLAFAQGTVVFQNDSRGLVMQELGSGVPGLVSVPKGGAMVELFTAAHGTPLQNPLGVFDGWGFELRYITLASYLAANPGWHSEAVGGVNSADGIFDNGTVSLTGIPGGASADYFIIGWSGTYPSLDTAIANDAWLGYSNQRSPLTTLTGDPTTTPPGTPVNLKDTFNGMVLGPQVPIPEPSIFVLSALAAVTLLLLRRRR